MKRTCLTLAVLGSLLMLAACATRPMGDHNDPALVRGLIDGVMAPISFVISLFSETVRMYAYPNIGRWYDLGFLIGLSAWGGGASTVTRYVYVDRRTGRTLDIEER